MMMKFSIKTGRKRLSGKHVENANNQNFRRASCPTIFSKVSFLRVVKARESLAWSKLRYQWRFDIDRTCQVTDHKIFDRRY